MISFKSHILRLAHLVGMHYITVPAKFITEMGGISGKRFVCTVNDLVSFQCGIVALGEGKGYISINKLRLKKLGCGEFDEVSVNLVPDRSELGMEIPEELIELFAQDEEGYRRFNILPPGKKRYIVYYISQVKSVHLRAERAVKLITNLRKLPEGNEEFRHILGKR